MDILGLLADGLFHSGEELGANLGISRAAVSKQLAVLRERGLEIDVVHGKGYRLRDPFDLLDAAKIVSYVGNEGLLQTQQLLVEAEVASTNDVLMGLVKEGRSFLVCLAERQLAGRGRRGRSWLSPFAGNFYGSFSWTFHGGFPSLEGLSLAVGVAVAEALEEIGCHEIRLKWPNDLVVRGRKLGGILLEVQGESDGACHVVVGIGVNFRQTEGMQLEIAQPVTDVCREVGRDIDRNLMAATIVRHVLGLLQDYEQQGFACWRQRWITRDANRDMPVEILGLSEPVLGIARGVDEHGALLLETGRGLQRVTGGEVSVRRSAAGG